MLIEFELIVFLKHASKVMLKIDNQLEIRRIGINRPVSELLSELKEIERYKTKQLSEAYLYSTPKPILGQQFYSNEDIDRLIEEQLLEVIKHAKKTLAKKPGPAREKADKICVDYFLDEVLKNMGNDPDPNSFYADVDPVEDMRRQLEDLQINLTKIAKAIKKNSSKPKSSHHKTKSKSRTKKKKSSKHVNAHIISDESYLDFSDSENNSDLSGTSESSNSESNSEEYEVNAAKKKITFSDTKRSKKHKSARPKTSSKKSSNASSDKKNIDSFSCTQPKEVSINSYNIINAKFIALKDPILNHFTSNFSNKEYEKFWHEITMLFSHILQPISDLIRIASQQTNILLQSPQRDRNQKQKFHGPTL
ncbi:hypothetical protein F8M41_004625 [Gigaspora margarita]|uniref:Uncharacterized protein n=1 Tax=Gigaspora margarita TaxID=4874 RepID=A0A8H4A5A3_GIGMA|nr:hypothetical protein F8M41_004625 [Gigaspora margarita]